MDTLDAIRAEAAQTSADRFAHAHPAPVLVLREELEGDMQFAEPGREAVPRQGSTLIHVPRGAVEEKPERDPRRRSVPEERYATLTLSPDAQAPRLLLGRERWCDIQLADYTVSAEHCRLYPVRRTPRAFIEDAGSRNGTARNGVPLRPGERRELHSGDEIMVGRFVLLFLNPWDFHQYLSAD